MCLTTQVESEHVVICSASGTSVDPLANERPSHHASRTQLCRKFIRGMEGSGGGSKGERGERVKGGGRQRKGDNSAKSPRGGAKE